MIGFCFYKRSFDLIYKMGPKKARKKVGKIEVPTDTPTELKLGITAADIQRRRHERKQRKWEEAEKQQREERKREEARRVETPESTEEAVAKKRTKN